MQRTDYTDIGETIYSAQLPNGLNVRVVPKPEFNSGYAVLAVNYGGSHRRFSLGGQVLDTPAGVAHFLEHKMFDMPDGDNALSLLSANGADPNAFTSGGVTCYYFQCTRNLEDNLRLLLRFVTTPYFTPETVQKEQGIIAQEIRMGDDSPGSAIYYNLLELLYAHHPIRDKIAGTVESIAEIDDKVLYNCHKVFYTPANMVLCVEGDVDPERIAAIAREVLTPERAEKPQADFGQAETLLPVAPVRSVEMPISAPQFLIGSKLRCEPEGEARLRQQITAQLALRMLVGSSSHFYTRLYEKGLLNRDFDYETDFTAGTATLIIGGESSDPDAVLAELAAESAAVSKNGFDADYFERAKRASAGARLRGLEDFGNVCLSVALGLFDGFNALDSFKLLQSITAAGCAAFVADCLSPERLAISIIEPKRS